MKQGWTLNGKLGASLKIIGQTKYVSQAEKMCRFCFCKPKGAMNIAEGV